MKKNSQNTWQAKLKRTFTSMLPVAKNRRGKCTHCGACCKLPNVCFFYDTEKTDRHIARFTQSVRSIVENIPELNPNASQKIHVDLPLNDFSSPIVLKNHESVGSWF